jgi:hypothetical protein
MYSEKKKMRCPLTQLGINMEEIRNRLNTSTEEYIKIVTIMPSIDNAEDRKRFTDMIAPLLVLDGWTLAISANIRAMSQPNPFITLGYLRDM